MDILEKDKGAGDTGEYLVIQDLDLLQFTVCEFLGQLANDIAVKLGVFFEDLRDGVLGHEDQSGRFENLGGGVIKLIREQGTMPEDLAGLEKAHQVLLAAGADDQ
jgi:hypothetical protein